MLRAQHDQIIIILADPSNFVLPNMHTKLHENQSSSFGGVLLRTYENFIIMIKSILKKRCETHQKW